ncbi:MAG: molybdopterin molybdotransferase MoeA, partial [Proteobacteria bacterium]|nr:molybdopterin molybdotransferase MoeA [Pseudomonadota bacterium]
MAHDFLTLLSRDEFQALLTDFPLMKTETVPLEGVRGRVLTEELLAPEDLPQATRSCMDGYAVNARDLFGASESNPSYLELAGDIPVDHAPEQILERGHCMAIPTGGTLPQGADAVVMVEHTLDMEGNIEIRKSIAPGDNVMLQGEDATTGVACLAAGTRLRTQEIGLLAALGVSRVGVRSAPRVAILSTGDELVPIESRPWPGQVRDVNSHTVACLVREAGGLPMSLGISPDDLDGLTRTLAEGVGQFDVVLVSGGSSAGVRDLSVEAIERIGGEVLAHGVAISPGKPTILARRGSTPIIGLPGQVTSVQVVMHVLIMPFLRQLQGEPHPFARSSRNLVRAELAKNV